MVFRVNDKIGFYGRRETILILKIKLLPRIKWTYLWLRVREGHLTYYKYVGRIVVY